MARGEMRQDKVLSLRESVILTTFGMNISYQYWELVATV